jgi:hypothetical protein
MKMLEIILRKFVLAIVCIGFVDIIIAIRTKMFFGRTKGYIIRNLVITDILGASDYRVGEKPRSSPPK